VLNDANSADYTVVVALDMAAADASRAALQVARAVTNALDGRLLIAATVEVPAGTSLSEGTISAQQLRQELFAIANTLASAAEGVPVQSDSLAAYPPRTAVRVGRESWLEVRALAIEERAALLVIALPISPDEPPDSDVLIGGTPLQTVLEEAPCDIALVRGQLQGLDTQGGAVLLPVRGGPQAELALSLADALTGGNAQASITALHVIRPDLPAADQVREEQPFAALRMRLNRHPKVRRVTTVSRDVTATLLAEAGHHDWLLMGVTAQANATSPASTAVLGSIPAAILRQAPSNVVLVKTREAVGPIVSRARSGQEGVFALDPETLSLIVDKWFAENTFHANEFSDLDALVALKRRQGLTISLGLPALNEEATLASVIGTLKEALFDRVPLLDEIVLIDSDSTDRTREIAAEFGIPIHIHQQVLPEAGPALRGKGEALWKSLHVLRGDIIVWVDTDITNMTPQFVYGLLGPLLQEPRIKYVKGYYRRPIKSGGVLQEEGGGRVTELTARPMFNLFYPQLSGLIQPLAGEYAARREVLEGIPFFSGYGVETGHLIDVLEMYGLSAIGQVNLGQRIHRNQPLQALSRMSFAIMQVILERVQERRGITLLEGANRSMKQIVFADNRLSLDVKAVRDTERPPISKIEAYRQARAGQKQDS